MNFLQPQALKEIASLIECEYVGDPNFEVLGMNEIHVVLLVTSSLWTIQNITIKPLLLKQRWYLSIKKWNVQKEKLLLISDDPFRDFNKLTAHFKPFQASHKPISDSAKIGTGTTLQPNCFIGNNVVIGDHCTIHSNVSIYDGTIIGDNVIIHANTVLGASAFYYKKRPEGYDQLQSCGRVIIENEVHIGASCTIDRGVTGDTTIGAGSKLDNLIQVGHDTLIGKNCLIASQTGIAGCCVIEDDVTIWGQVGTTSGITIGAKAVVLGQTGVSKSIEGGKTYFGTPIEEARTKLKELALLRKLPEIIQELKQNKNG